MPKVFVKDAGVWKQAQSVWIKQGGVWVRLAKGFVRSGGAYRQFYPDTASTVTYSSVGTFSYPVPAGVTNVNIAYPTTSGLANTTRAVTPGSNVTVVIGGFGAASSFGGFALPVYSVNVGSVATNVDQAPGLFIQQDVATSVARSFSGTGFSAELNAAAAAAGIYYLEYNEGSQGDFPATVTLNTVAISTLINSYQVAITSFTGRGSFNLFQQPSAGNAYRYGISISDPEGSNAPYTYTATLRQIVSLAVTPV